MEVARKLSEAHELCLTIAVLDDYERLQRLCNFFLGTEYGSWGEGSNLTSLDDFNYKFEKLDCVTYVEMVLALFKTTPVPNAAIFQEIFANNLRRIQYLNGKPQFLSRNHFMCLDWIPNNKYLVEDITPSLTLKCAMATAVIDKLNWVKKHKIMQNSNSTISDEIANSLKPQEISIPYIPTEEFLENQMAFKKKFPAYGIVNIVRPNWDLTEQIGTHMNISHLGFVFNAKDSQQLDFYHASSERKMVVQETLFDYMMRLKDSPTIRGFNVLVISPGYLHAG
jgi:hypothetical protein